jgi:membrane-associated phospholipid phosphatase
MMTQPASSTLSMHIARILSNLLSPPIIALGTVVVFAFYSPIGTGLIQPWQSLLVGIIFVVIGPIIPVVLMVGRGKMTFDVTNRRDRPLLYLAAIIVYFIGALIAWFYYNHTMAVIAIAYAGVTSVIALVSLYWKVSAHSAGVAGPITGLIWVYGFLFIPFMLLAVLVAWARWKLTLHSPSQLLVGILIAIFVTAVVYWVLWGFPFGL